MSSNTQEDKFEAAQNRIAKSLPSDIEFSTALSNKVIKSNSRGHYILRKIDQWHNREGAYVLMGPSELQLEHVAPRKPSQSSGWKSKIGDSGYSDLVSRIGNMILLKKRPNRESSNKSFKDKLKVYKEQNNGKYPALSKEVFEFTDWNANIIEERSSKISELAVEVWSHKARDVKGKTSPRSRAKPSKRKIAKGTSLSQKRRKNIKRK